MTGSVHIVEPKLYTGTFSVTNVPKQAATIIASVTIPAGLYILNASI